MSNQLKTGHAAASTQSLLGTGTVVGSRYLVRRVVGRGAFAIVYEAIHADLGQRVALKTAYVDADAIASIDGAAERYRREAAVCARIKSVHVPRIHDVGCLPDGSPYLVMDYLDGKRLDSVLGQKPLPLHVAVELCRHLLRALDAVHRARSIHRDVKPQNVMLTHDGAGNALAKLFDFGICKPLVRSGSNLTLDGILIGTPHYMAPEQARCEDLDERVDVYAAGVVLYEMLTSRLPFEADDAQDVIRAVLHAPFLPPGILRPDCPSRLEDVVMQALARDREERYGSAQAMLDDLECAGAALVPPAKVPGARMARAELRRPARDTLRTRSTDAAERRPRLSEQRADGGGPRSEGEPDRPSRTGPVRAMTRWVPVALLMGLALWALGRLVM